MYLLRMLGYDHMKKCIIVEKGIKFGIVDNKTVPAPGFWGETEIRLGHFANMSKLEKFDSSAKMYMLTYANEYMVENKDDNLKKLIFNVSTYQSDEIEGCIIFTKNYRNVKTDGKILFRKYQNEVVVVLRDGQQLEYDGGKIEYFNGKLVLI